MVLVLDGKTYDTETDIFLGYMDNGPQEVKFEGYYEELYMSRESFEFYIHANGDPLSIYPKETINVISDYKAKLWLSKHFKIK